jgi:uncharacterized Tic20 family protein
MDILLTFGISLIVLGIFGWIIALKFFAIFCGVVLILAVMKAYRGKR